MLYVQSDSQPYQMSEYSEKLKKKNSDIAEKANVEGTSKAKH